MLRALGLEREHFRLVSFRVFDDKWDEEQAPFSEAIVVIDGPDGRRREAPRSATVRSTRWIRRCASRWSPTIRAWLRCS